MPVDSSSESFIIHLSKPAKAAIRKMFLWFLVIVACFVVFVSSIDSPFTKSVRDGVVSVFVPIVKTVHKPVEVIDAISSSIDSYLFVRDNNAILRKENFLLKQSVVRMREIKQENDRLRNLLNYVDNQKFDYITALLVTDYSGPFMRKILVNVGQKDGIKKGQSVISDKGLVGRVIEVGRVSSRVLLLTDVNSKVPVVTSMSREKAIVSGQNDDTPRLLYLPKENSVQSGEIVETTGDGDIFPAGLQVGVVEKKDGNIYEIKPFVTWNLIDEVSILVNSFDRLEAANDNVEQKEKGLE